MLKIGKELRKEYKFGEKEEKYEVGKKKCRAEQMTVRSMNFGQHWRTEGIVDLEYKIELPIKYVLDFLSENIGNYIEDSKLCPDPDCKFEQMLREANWPTPDYILQNKDLFALAFEFYSHEMILYWFGDLLDSVTSNSPTYVINTVELDSVLPHSIVLTGRTRQSGLLNVLYQDV